MTTAMSRPYRRKTSASAVAVADVDVEVGVRVAQLAGQPQHAPGGRAFRRRRSTGACRCRCRPRRRPEAGEVPDRLGADQTGRAGDQRDAHPALLRSPVDRRSARRPTASATSDGAPRQTAAYAGPARGLRRSYASDRVRRCYCYWLVRGLLGAARRTSRASRRTALSRVGADAELVGQLVRADVRVHGLDLRRPARPSPGCGRRGRGALPTRPRPGSATVTTVRVGRGDGGAGPADRTRGGAVGVGLAGRRGRDGRADRRVAQDCDRVSG